MVTSGKFSKKLFRLVVQRRSAPALIWGRVLLLCASKSTREGVLLEKAVPFLYTVNTVIESGERGYADEIRRVHGQAGQR